MWENVYVFSSVLLQSLKLLLDLQADLFLYLNVRKSNEAQINFCIHGSNLR